MKLRRLPAIFIFAFMSLVLISCPGPQPKDFYASVQEKYFDLKENSYNPETVGQTGWTYKYHMMLYAAWVIKGQGNVDADFETELKKGNETFWKLNDEISNVQTAADIDALFDLIDDEEVKAKSKEYYETDFLNPLNAYTRAFSDVYQLGESTVTDEDPGPSRADQLLVLLGQLYTDRPDLCELPENPTDPDDDSRWRDWLQRCLGASPLALDRLIQWDDQLENLQSLIPDEKFWNGRLTHAYSLRSIQFSGAFGYEKLIERLEKYREGGEVSGFDAWAYWNLAYTAYAPGTLAPYNQEDIGNIDSFLIDGLKEGPTNDGEEAWVVADSLGRAPSVYFADQLFEIAEDENISCVRKQLCYTALGNMFYSPLDSWIPDDETKTGLKNKAVDLMANPDVSCAQIPVLELFRGATSAFYPYLYGNPQTWEMNHQDFVRLNESFRNFALELDTADERLMALDLLLTNIGQADFLIFYDRADDYHAWLISLHDDWLENTRYEGTEVQRDDVENLLRLFNNSLGNWDMLDKYLKELDE